MTQSSTDVRHIRGRGPVGRVVRAIVAVAIVISLIVTFIDASAVDGFDPVNVLSYFTILSNIAAVYVMGRAALSPEWRESNTAVIGAVTLYMTITGLIYAFVLRPIGADVGEYRPWVDFIQHTAGPAALVMDWLLFTPRAPIGKRFFFGWFVFPLLYLPYSLIRGAITGWYPYPFLDPDSAAGGHTRVAISVVVILGVFIAVAVFLRWWASSETAEPVPVQ